MQHSACLLHICPNLLPRYVDVCAVCHSSTTTRLCVNKSGSVAYSKCSHTASLHLAVSAFARFHTQLSPMPPFAHPGIVLLVGFGSEWLPNITTRSCTWRFGREVTCTAASHSCSGRTASYICVNCKAYHRCSSCTASHSCSTCTASHSCSGCTASHSCSSRTASHSCSSCTASHSCRICKAYNSCSGCKASHNCSSLTASHTCAGCKDSHSCCAGISVCHSTVYTTQVAKRGFVIPCMRMPCSCAVSLLQPAEQVNQNKAVIACIQAQICSNALHIEQSVVACLGLSI